MKENTANIKIIEHLVGYIKEMSLAYVDLTDEFGSIITQDDPVLSELGRVFSKGLIENYFVKIFNRLDQVLTNLTNGKSEQLNVFKFYFFYFIVYRMNDIVISFNNSNINYLLVDEMLNLDTQLDRYMNNFYFIPLNKLKDMNVLFMNKDINNLYTYKFNKIERAYSVVSRVLSRFTSTVKTITITNTSRSILLSSVSTCTFLSQ
jgi:hypothetical protein